jgi:ankyrin repeat protein
LEVRHIAPPLGVSCSNNDDEPSLEEVHVCLWEAYDPANPLLTDDRGFTVLHKAVRIGAGPRAIDHLLHAMTEEDREKVLKMRTRDGLSALDIAAAVGSDPLVIPHLVAWGADVNAGFINANDGKFGWLPGRALAPARRPLHHAAMRTDGLRFDAMAYLLAMGADITALDGTSEQQPAQEMLGLTSDCEPQDARTGNTAMHLVLRVRACVEWADQEQIDSLLLVIHATQSMRGLRELTVGRFSNEIRQVPNAQDATPLQLAASLPFTSTFIIDQLLRRGADPDLDDERGWTPLLVYARVGKDPDAFAQLLEASQTACDQNVEGVTLSSMLKQNLDLTDAETFEGRFLHNLVETRCAG